MANVAAGRYEAAVPSLRRAVELDPTTVRLKDDLARAEALAKK
jgi:Flp pilus assembly protein TadD